MTILIKNGLVYDGSGTIPEKKDILIRGEKIIALGNFSKSQADETIEAMGAIVTPGVIDINTDSDHFLSIFTEPYQIDFVKQGVTTIIGGNCGISLAPLFNNSFDLIAHWSDVSKVNINWHSVEEFLNLIEKRKIGVNFGTLVGHSTIRQAFFKKDESRDPTEMELNSFKQILKQALKEGAFGLSVGLTYLPYRRLTFWEIKELVKLVASTKSVYAVHLRDIGAGL
jgi:N-acyl-D-amino-acid deacylase